MNGYFKRTLIFLFTGMIITLFMAYEALSIPVFARKFNKRCSVCHEAVPKLNPLGERFRLNGYQFPGTIDDTPVWHQDTPPFSGMIHAMYMNMNMENNGPMPMRGIAPGSSLTISNFQFTGLEIFSGGTLGKRLSYFAMYELEEHGDLEDGKWVSEIETEFEQMFGVFNNIDGGNTGNLNIRGGIFEMELPFSSLRALGGESIPYLVYSAAPTTAALAGEGEHAGTPPFSIDKPQIGVSVYGILPFDLQYEAAVVNGTNNEVDTNEDKDFYFRLAQHFGNHRIGSFYYTGTANLGTNVAEQDDDFWRWGVDVSTNFLIGKTHLNLFGQYVWGKDDNISGISEADHGEEEAEHQEDTGPRPQEFEYQGFFVEANLSIIPHKLVAMARYEVLDVDEQAAIFREDDVRRTAFQLRYYFKPNFFTLLQYHHQDNMLGVMGGNYGVMDMDMDMFMTMLIVTF